MSDILAVTVLVVEDEAFVRMIAADALSDFGFIVIEAVDAAEAIQILSEHVEIAVLFTDINMPGEMDGLRLAEKVAREQPKIRIVVTSGGQFLSDASLPNHGRFIPKPYRQADLTTMIVDQIACAGQ